MVSSPAAASPTELVLGPISPVTEGGTITIPYVYNGESPASYTITIAPGVVNAASQARYGTPSATTLNVDPDISASLTGSITITTTDDSLYEGTQTLVVTATGNSEAPTATATINDNDPAPSYTLSASPATVTEPASAMGTTTTAVSARLSAVSGVPTSIVLGSTDGTAKQPSNYTTVSGTLTVPAGQLVSSNTVSATVKGDGVKDSADTMSFTVNGTADNAWPTSASTPINITDAQTTPRLTLSGGGAAAEGNNLTFTVTPTTPSQLPITFTWNAVSVTPATGDDQATPGADFTYPDNRTVTIAPNAASATITLPLINDGLNENTEDFAIKISNPVNATLGDVVQVPGQITDANAAAKPSIAITPTSVMEGDSGTTARTFTATLSQASGRTVTAKWATADDTVAYGHAVAGKDYVASSGTLVFPAGTTTQTFTIGIIGDTIDEGAGETFKVNLTAPAGDTTADLGSPTTNITITDDDSAPTMSFDDLSTKEGDAPNALLMPIKLSNASDHDIQFNLTDTTGLNSGTATDAVNANAGSNDYDMLNATVVIPAGLTTGYLVVLDNGDMVYEPDETAYFTATTDAGSTAYTTTTAKTAKLTLQNDDNAPSLEINSIAGHEGDTLAVTGTVHGISSTATYLTVWFAGESVKGSVAANDRDFVNPGVVPITIPASTLPDTVLPVASVVLNDDTLPEPKETIIASGNGVGNVGSVTDGVITILPSDGGTSTPPTIAAPATVTGASTATITGKAAPYATVELWGAPLAGNADLAKLAETSASSTGAYSFSKALSAGYRFQAKSNELLSSIVTTKVNQAPVFTVGSPSAGKLSLSVKGNPAGVGQTLTVDVFKNGKWVIGWHGTTGSDTTWKATVAEKSKSMWTLRAYVAGDAGSGINSGYAATKKVTIK